MPNRSILHVLDPASKLRGRYICIDLVGLIMWMPQIIESGGVCVSVS
jgi:hypothetical protein